MPSYSPAATYGWRIWPRRGSAEYFGDYSDCAADAVCVAVDILVRSPRSRVRGWASRSGATDAAVDFLFLAKTAKGTPRCAMFFLHDTSTLPYRSLIPTVIVGIKDLKRKGTSLGKRSLIEKLLRESLRSPRRGEKPTTQHRTSDSGPRTSRNFSPSANVYIFGNPFM